MPSAKGPIEAPEFSTEEGIVLKLSRFVFASAAAVVLAGPASSAAAKSVAYFDVPASGQGYLIDWQTKKRARVVNRDGASGGDVVDDGAQRLVTLDQPLSSPSNWGYDECGDYSGMRSVEQVVIRDLPGGESEIVEIGVDVIHGGCRDGETTPFGTPNDPGWSMQRMAMSARPSMSDVVAGLQLAGPTEEAWPERGNFFPSQDVATIYEGSVSFQRSGRTWPTAVSTDGWWVVQRPDIQRAHTRLKSNSKTGGEVWLVADWVDGVPQRVSALNFVKTSSDAGFGSLAQAARMWQVGWSVGTRTPYFYYLYKNGSGERVMKFLDTGTEQRNPITSWGLDGLELWQRTVSIGVYQRRWAPLRNQGEKIRWVMETYHNESDGVTRPIILPRVVYLVDAGKAVPPTK